MSLNVKDPEAHRLAQAIAQATGESMTRVVIHALREKWERLPGRKKDSGKVRKDLLALARQAALADNLPYSNHDFLYDEFGLPK